MWYWIVMAVLVIGCIALLSGTFFSIKKNKAEEAAKRAEARKKKRKKPADAEEAQQPGDRRKRADGRPQSSQGAENGRQQDAQARREEARRAQAEQRKEQKKRRQWKVILEDLDSWTKYSFIFYSNIEQSQDRAMRDIFHYQKMEGYLRSTVSSFTEAISYI